MRGAIGTVIVITVGVVVALAASKVFNRMVVDPLLLKAAPGEPKGAAADLPLEERKEQQTETD